MCRDASCPLLSLLLLFEYFLVLPSLLISSIYLVAFYTYLCSFFLRSIATKSERCGLVFFGTRLCADVDKSVHEPLST